MLKLPTNGLTRKMEEGKKDKFRKIKRKGKERKEGKKEERGNKTKVQIDLAPSSNTPGLPFR